MEKIDCPYLLNGFDSRRDYLDSLAEANGISRPDVYALAQMLGKEEDFDGLVSMLDDISFMDDFADEL